jgi:hypothetical protein
VVAARPDALRAGASDPALIAGRRVEAASPPFRDHEVGRLGGDNELLLGAS